MAEVGAEYEVQGRKWRNWAVILKLPDIVRANNAFEWHQNKMLHNESPYVDLRIVRIVRSTVTS